MNDETNIDTINTDTTTDTTIDDRPDLTNLVCVYVRVSTHNQDGKLIRNKWLNKESFNSQLEECRKYALSKNLIVKDRHGLFYGEAKSGAVLVSTKKTKHRYEFFSCIEALELSKKDYPNRYLLCYSVSRLTRSLDDAKIIYNFCNEHGIKLLFAKEDLLLTKETEGKFFDFVKKAEDFLVKNKKTTIDAQDFLKSIGKHHAGKPQFGKEVDSDGYLVNNPKEKDIKSLAISLKNLGNTYQQISDFFNKKGYLTRTKKRWKHNLVRNIIFKLELDPVIQKLYKELKKSYKIKDLKSVQDISKSLIKQLAKIHNITISTIEGTPLPYLVKDKVLQKQVSDAYKSYSSQVKKKGVTKAIRDSQAFNLASLIGNLASILVSNLSEKPLPKIKLRNKIIR